MTFPTVPRMQRGDLFIVIEPTGYRFLFRWQGRIEKEIRWDPETVSGGSEWHRMITYPNQMRLGAPKWDYAFTRKGIERKLRRWLEKQEAEKQRNAQREEYKLKRR